MNKIRVHFKDGRQFEVPAQAEASQRRMNGHLIDFIEPVGGKGMATIEAEKEDAVKKMIAAKEAAIAARMQEVEPQSNVLTISNTKAEITAALTAAGIQFNPNHRKQDLFNLYVSSRTN